MAESTSKPCKVVYAVTSSGRDIYSVMTRVSVASIRISNPDFAIVLGCDDHSVVAMRQGRDPLLDEVDELLVCRTPPGDSAFRNRFVKTQLRLLVDGPFLFLDSDTLVRDNISEVFLLDTDIACAPNLSKDNIEKQLSVYGEEILLMGWSHRQDVFVNGGVIFYNNTRGAALFAENWHLKWRDVSSSCLPLSSYAATEYRDQAALNAAIFDTAPRLEILPHRFNAQLKYSPGIVSSAVIWHFQFSQRDEPITEFERLVLKLLKGAELQRSHVESLIQRDHPWTRDSWLDDLVARRVIKNGGFLYDSDTLWFRGHRIRSMPTLLPRLLIGRTNYDRVKRMILRLTPHRIPT